MKFFAFAIILMSSCNSGAEDADVKADVNATFKEGKRTESGTLVLIKKYNKDNSTITFVRGCVPDGDGNTCPDSLTEETMEIDSSFVKSKSSTGGGASFESSFSYNCPYIINFNDGGNIVLKAYTKKINKYAKHCVDLSPLVNANNNFDPESEEAKNYPAGSREALEKRFLSFVLEYTAGGFRQKFGMKLHHPFNPSKTISEAPYLANLSFTDKNPLIKDSLKYNELTVGSLYRVDLLVSRENFDHIIMNVSEFIPPIEAASNSSTVVQPSQPGSSSGVSTSPKGGVKGMIFDLIFKSLAPEEVSLTAEQEGEINDNLEDIKSANEENIKGLGLGAGIRASLRDRKSFAAGSFQRNLNHALIIRKILGALANGLARDQENNGVYKMIPMVESVFNLDEINSNLSFSQLVSLLTDDSDRNMIEYAGYIDGEIPVDIFMPQINSVEYTGSKKEGDLRKHLAAYSPQNKKIFAYQNNEVYSVDPAPAATNEFYLMHLLTIPELNDNPLLDLNDCSLCQR